ncbi:DUF4435 domain-containing protein [Thiocystis violacea]|uniref:DUF4435 domain-containing protein n=1 Tax=Thiocystis violacea TaxID=13725 RepID=UPI001906A020|nr:DUF4435 domain-containing protein [Thiocystis violacea]MBK1720307.1 hypothetical protein [Thiocystis violacea]
MAKGYSRKEIKEQLIGVQEKRAVLIEGTTDQQAFEILLRRFVADWDRRWVLAQVGGKKSVVEILRQESGWLGLVDRDEWDEAVIMQWQAELPNLMVLPRFCLENYLIDPAELWQAIPLARQASLVGGEATFRATIENQLPDYRRHGALWKVVTPLWSGLRALGFKEALASAKSVTTAQDDSEIRRILGEWDALLDPDRIFVDFQTRLAAAEAAPPDAQFAHWLHGKVFWKNVVNPTLNATLGQMEEGERRKKILRKLPQPADLQPVFDRLI